MNKRASPFAHHYLVIWLLEGAGGVRILTKEAGNGFTHGAERLTLTSIQTLARSEFQCGFHR